MHQPRISELRKVLTERFSDDEIRTLCQDLSVDYENLSGTTKSAKARELLMYLERRMMLHRLIIVGLDLRPDIPWSNYFTTHSENNTEEVRQALSAALPEQFHQYGQQLAEVIYLFIAGRIPLEDFRTILETNRAFGEIIKRLSGENLLVAETIVSFGIDNQIGDVTFRDVAGRDIINLAINFGAD